MTDDQQEQSDEVRDIHKRIREHLLNTPDDVLREQFEKAGGWVREKSEFDVWFEEAVLGRKPNTEKNG